MALVVPYSLAPARPGSMKVRVRCTVLWSYRSQSQGSASERLYAGEHFAPAGGGCKPQLATLIQPRAKRCLDKLDRDLRRKIGPRRKARQHLNDRDATDKFIYGLALPEPPTKYPERQ